MALIKCPECGREISEKAESCPLCGCPVSVEKSKETLKSSDLKGKGKDEEKVVVVKKGSGCSGCMTILLLLIIGFLFFCYYISRDEDLGEEPSTCEYITVNKMRDDLKSNEIKAQSIYVNKWFNISGLLGDMDSDGYYFYLDDEHLLFAYHIKCRIPREKRTMIVNKLKEKQKGEKLTVKGKVTDMGESMGYEVTIVDVY